MEHHYREDSLTVTTSFAMRIAVAPDVMFRIVGDESVLLNLKSETYLGLDAVGTRMWTLLTGSESIQSAYETLLGEYEVGDQQLRRDLEEFVGKLLENDLVLIGSAEPVVSGAE
jgi:coenzyme PQQ synthesis protein D (PqqD)